MEQFENSAMRYIATDLSTSLIPQFGITRPGWEAYPDFVAFNLKRKVVYVVEVTASANVSGLCNRIQSMFDPDQHIETLRGQLQRLYPELNLHEWPIKVAAFIGRRAFDAFEPWRNTQLAGTHRASVLPFALDDVMFPWQYWDRIVGENRGWDSPAID